MTDIVEVYSSANETEARHLVNLLADQDIEATIVGELLNGVIGEVPHAVAAPRIWTKACDSRKARTLIEDWEQARREKHAAPSEPQVPGWTCPKCETEIEAEFDVCWNCLYNPSAC